MMHDTVACPDCRSQLTLPTMPVGQSVQCPRCQIVFVPMPHVSTLLPTNEMVVNASPPRGALPDPIFDAWKAWAAIIFVAISVLMLAWNIMADVERIVLIEQHNTLKQEEFQHAMAQARGPGIPIMPPKWREQRDALRQRRDVLQGQFRQADRMSRMAANGLDMAFWPSGIALLAWIAQAVGTTRGFHPAGFTHTAGLAAGSFFVPIMNLFWPYRVVHDVWRVSAHPSLFPGVDGPTSWLVRAWWSFSLTSVALVVVTALVQPDFQFHFPQLFFGVEPSEDIRATAFVCATHISMFIAGVLLVIIIRTIAKNQQTHFDRLYENAK